MGEIQLEILKNIIYERFDINVQFGPGSIAYKETIANKVEGVGHYEPLRHYAEVHLILEPLKRGSGLIFSTDCREDLLNKNWQRLIISHLKEKTHIGVLTGSPITDMRITLVSGRLMPSILKAEISGKQPTVQYVTVLNARKVFFLSPGTVLKSSFPPKIPDGLFQTFSK